jgi:hypothetical protein
MLLDQVLLFRTACASKHCFFLNQFMPTIAEAFKKGMVCSNQQVILVKNKSRQEYEFEQARSSCSCFSRTCVEMAELV